MTRLNQQASPSNREETSVSSLSELAAAFTHLAVAVEALTASKLEQKPVINTKSVEQDAPLPEPSVRPSVRNKVETNGPRSIDECIAAAVASGDFIVDPDTYRPLSPPSTVQPVVEAPSPLPPAPETPSASVPTPTELAIHIASIPDPGKWFLVTQGKEPGVYSTWAETSPLVTGVSRAIHSKHNNREDALQGYMQAWLRGDVIRRM